MPPSAFEKQAINILWTGGWDSTFRLLSIVLEEKRSVQPYYVIDPHRHSTRHEIKAMQDIIQHVTNDHPNSQSLISPIKIIQLKDIKEDPEITAAFNQLVSTTFFGEQYEWFARYCQQHHIDDMELCIDRSPTTLPRFSPFLSQVDNSPVYIYNNDKRDLLEYKIFNYYRYPIFGYTKTKMGQIAEKRFWHKYMSLTWFCHTPIFGSIPCGKCAPCQQVMIDGLGWRLPLISRLMFFIQKTKTYQYLKNLIKVNKHAK